MLNAVRLAALVWILTTVPAHAYLDPGTGSILLQGIVGAIAGGLFVMRMYWQRVKAFVTGRPAPGADRDSRDDRDPHGDPDGDAAR